MYDYIFLLGAQGSGKTTIARILKEKLKCPHIDFDWIRGFHMNKDWSNIAEDEHQLSLENLIFILHNYKKHNYRPVIVSGFTESDSIEVLDKVKGEDYIVITLFLTNDEELKKRVLTETRDSGFRDYDQSTIFNRKLRDALTLPHEHKIDNTSNDPENSINQILLLLSES